jgi:hypothetical protein
MDLKLRIIGLGSFWRSWWCLNRVRFCGSYLPQPLLKEEGKSEATLLKEEERKSPSLLRSGWGATPHNFGINGIIGIMKRLMPLSKQDMS